MISWRLRAPILRGRRKESIVTNLAKNLTDTIRAHAGRVAVRVDNAAMTYRALDEATAAATSSPRTGCGRPITAASATAGCS